MNTTKQIQDMRDGDWPAGLYIRGRSYRYRRRVPGQKSPFIEIWGPIPFDEAKRKARRYNFYIDDGKNPSKEKEICETTFKDFAYGTWLPKKRAGLAARSFARYKAVVDNFLCFLTEERRMPECLLSNLDYAVADDFKIHRQTTPIAPNGGKHLRILKDGASKNTLHFEVTTLRQIFKEAVNRRLIEVNPFTEVKAKKPTPDEIRAKHHPLSVEEEKLLLPVAHAWNHSKRSDKDLKSQDIFLFLIKTGLREDELCNLEWTDVDFAGGVIKVQRKTVSETRRIPIPASAMPHIKKLISGKMPDDFLFAIGDELTKKGVQLAIRKKEDLAQIKACEVDLNGRFIQTTRSYLWKPKGSGGVVPMNKTVQGLLKRLHARRCSNFVFPHHDGGRCRLKLLDILKKEAMMAGIEGHVRVHDLRHTTAVRLRREHNTSIETIMGIMRHADIRDTLIYAPYHIEEGKKAIMKLDDPDDSDL